MAGHLHRIVRVVAPAIALVAASVLAVPAGGAATSSADAKLDATLPAIVAKEDGPPGISLVVQRDATPVLHTAGVADTTTKAPIAEGDAMRIASMAKAFRQAVGASVDVAPPPAQLLSFVADQPLGFEPGTQYRYSNSDNVIIGLMVQAATGMAYEDALAARVYGPMGLTNTGLPSGTDLPTPTVHGYLPDPPVPPEDVTSAFAAGWAWASGEMVSTPGDLNRFVRAYASGKTATPAALPASSRSAPGRPARRARGRTPRGWASTATARAVARCTGTPATLPVHPVHGRVPRREALGGRLGQRQDQPGGRGPAIQGAQADLHVGGVRSAQGLGGDHGRPRDARALPRDDRGHYGRVRQGAGRRRPCAPGRDARDLVAQRLPRPSRSPA